MTFRRFYTETKWKNWKSQPHLLKKIRWTSRTKAKCSRADVGERKIRRRSESVGIWNGEQIWKLWADQRRIRSSNFKSKTQQNRHEKAEKEKIKLRKRIEEELIIEEEKLKRRSELMEKLSGVSPASSGREVKVKLPKLEITKFNGTHDQILESI